MGIADEAHVFILIADYIGIDSAGKINALGAAFAMSGVQANNLSAPLYVAAVVDIPGKYHGEQFGFSLELRNEDTGQAVQVPDPATGLPGALRITQMFTVTRPSIPNAQLSESTFARTQMTVGFPNGVPVQSGHVYGWHAQLNGKGNSCWVARFSVFGPPPPPVFGGPAGPSSIPGLASPGA